MSTPLKPSLDEFSKFMADARGNMSIAAARMHVSRQAVYKWIRQDERYHEAVKNERKKMFDECLDQARILAMGIPKIDNGKLVGWKEKPDGQMLRYFLQTLGKDEGFGNALDITSGGKSIPQVINLISDDSIPNE